MNTSSPTRANAATKVNVRPTGMTTATNKTKPDNKIGGYKK